MSLLEGLLFAFLIGLALLFAFINGFHEGSSVVATSVLSRSIRPGRALLLVSVAEFAGAALLGTAVADVLGREVMNPVFFHPANHVASALVLFSALGGTITWNVMTWWVGMPPSSSHSLLGGLLGGAMAALGLDMLNCPVFLRLLLVLLLAPLAGVLAGRSAMLLCSLLSTQTREGMDRFCRQAHWLSLFFMGASHGSNNAQKAMGLITMALLISGSLLSLDRIPLWVSIGCGGAMGLGVYAGGWDIVKVLGNRIFRIRPADSFLSQVVSGAALLAATLMGCPVGGVETIKSTVMGVGSGRRGGHLLRLVLRDIVLAWSITVPATALLAAAIYWTTSGALGEGMGSFDGIMRSLGQ